MFASLSTNLTIMAACCTTACGTGSTQPRATASAGARAGSGSALGDQLDAHLTGLQARGFSGVVLVARGGQVVLNKGYGLANRQTGAPITPRTVFDIGSITKQFTAAAILQLEMQGTLAVTDSLGAFFANTPADKQGITLHHLLTHSAGLPPALGDDYEPLTRAAFIERALATPVQTAPGQRYAYSNVGYSLLTAIIEQVSGKGYEAFLNRHLFQPAGLVDTGYRLPGWPKERIATGYRGDQVWGRPTDKAWAADGPYWNLRGNGGLLSTAADMYRWHRALTDGVVLSPAARAKLLARHIKEDPEGRSHYGYGWVITETGRGTRLITHNGGNGIFFADFLHYADDDVVVFLASNGADFGVEELGTELGRMIASHADRGQTGQ